MPGERELREEGAGVSVESFWTRGPGVEHGKASKSSLAMWRVRKRNQP